MKAAIVTPFLSQLPLHPGSYLGYGAAILREKFELDILDLNAEIYFKNKDKLKRIFIDIENHGIVSDKMHFYPFYEELLHHVEKVYASISWQEYQSAFITTPSWFVTIPTDDILKLSDFIKKESQILRSIFLEIPWVHGQMKIN